MVTFLILLTKELNMPVPHLRPRDEWPIQHIFTAEFTATITVCRTTHYTAIDQLLPDCRNIIVTCQTVDNIAFFTNPQPLWFSQNVRQTSFCARQSNES